MSIELWTILVLVAMFVAASVIPVNLGVLAFAAAYIVGVGFADLTVDDLFLGFPGSLVVLLIGVTYLFGIAQANGTIDWLLRLGVRAVGGRVALLPWVMYALTAAIAAAGALAVAALACVAPVAMRSAARYGYSALMTGVMVCLGSVGGSFSPISPFGVIVNDTLQGAGLPTQPGRLMFANLAFSALLAVIVYAVFRGWRAAGDGPTEGVTRDGGESDEPASLAAGDLRPDWRQAVTLLAIVALVVGALVFDLDVGLTALVLATPLSVLAVPDPSKLVSLIPWSVVLLVAGMLTYIQMATELGVLDYVSDAINRGDNPLLAALMVCYVAAVISAFAATAGVLVATIPLVLPILQEGGLPVLGVTVAVCISATIVDSSPMSTNGALLLANQRSVPERSFFRQLLSWAVITIAVGPPLAWLVFVVPFA